MTDAEIRENVYKHYLFTSCVEPLHFLALSRVLFSKTNALLLHCHTAPQTYRSSTQESPPDKKFQLCDKLASKYTWHP